MIPDIPTGNHFGQLPDGTTVLAFILENSSGMRVEILNYGGIITKLFVPDKNGIAEDVVLGFDTLDEYLINKPFFGAFIGRFGNRINQGKFELDGSVHQLPINHKGNHIHGGPKALDKQVWDAETFSEEGLQGVKLTHTSPDGDMGYPGELQVEVIYSLDEENALKIEYAARTSKSTIINLTNHSYFNLTGRKDQTLDHEVFIDADHFIPTDERQIPTGEIRGVESTVFDFRKPKKISTDINSNDPQITVPGGFDHTFVLNKQANELAKIAVVKEPVSGRVMETFTTEPGVQFFTPNYKDEPVDGKDDQHYNSQMAFCLETQHFPDSPNHPTFPSTRLDPGDTFRSTTIYRFEW